MRQLEALLYVAFISCLTRSLQSQGTASLSLSDNPVYSGEYVTLTCSLETGYIMNSVTIDAFDGTHKKGSLWCGAATGKTTVSGIFVETGTLHGCGGVASGSRSVNLSMIASPSLELHYNCTLKLTNDHGTNFALESATTSLRVNCLQIIPSPAIFNESDNAMVRCESRLGTPRSVLQLTITSTSGSEIAASNNGSTSVTLPLPLVQWHHAVAKCIVISRNSTNISTSSVIAINYITCMNGPHDGSKKATDGTLNCSAYVSGYPIDSYSWTVPQGTNIGNSSSLNRSVLTLMSANVGTLNCTAANVVTSQKAVVVFALNSSDASESQQPNDWYVARCYVTTLTTTSFSPTQIEALQFSRSGNYWIICSALGGGFIIIGIALIITYRRRKICQNFQIQMENNDLYVPLYDLKSTDGTSAQPKKPDLVFHRLLLADKGVIDELSPLVLPTTVVMEYSTGYEALNEILVSLSKAIDLPTTPKFTSVGLFLPSVKHWVHDGEENQPRISNTSLTDENALTLEHFGLLAEMCLTQHSGSRGIDIFNYSGPDAASLAGMLTGALKIPVTVSYGYGIGETKDLKKLHASSAAKYFSFLRLATTTHQRVNSYACLTYAS